MFDESKEAVPCWSPDGCDVCGGKAEEMEEVGAAMPAMGPAAETGWSLATTRPPVLLYGKGATRLSPSAAILLPAFAPSTFGALL